MVEVEIFVCLKRMSLLSGLADFGFIVTFMDFRKIIQRRGFTFRKKSGVFT